MSLVDLGKRLLESAKLGETEEVRNLMTSGAPFTTDWLGTSPLHLAAQYGHVGTAEVLIRAGISRDARTKVDRTALHVAAQEGHVDIVNLLIKNGADIEAKDMLKMTPLHWAVEKSHVAVVELLLQNGADVNSLSKFEKSPVSIALDNGRLDVVHILQSSHRYRDPSLEVTIESNDSGDKDSKDGLVISDVVPHEDIRSIQSNLSSKSVPMKPIILRTNHSNAKPGSKSEVEEDANDQSSTSVLATLAALAETMGPINAGNNPSAAEALQWLESHGLTVLSQDNIITSVLESGQTLTLTEAGKLALNWSKRGKRCNDKMQDNLESTFGNIKNPANQKVIAFVTDNAQHAAGGVGNAGQIVVAMSNLGDRVNSVPTDAGTVVVEPALKRPKSENCTSDSIDDFAQLDRDQLARRLEEVQRKARDFEEQLRMKEHEAEEYKRKLESMSQQRTNTK